MPLRKVICPYQKKEHLPGFGRRWVAPGFRNGGKIMGEEHYPMDRMKYGETVEKIMLSGAGMR